MLKADLFYQGKEKTLYHTDNPERLILEFRDEATAFEGRRTAQLSDKGAVNNRINALVMQELQRQGLPTHFQQVEGEQGSVVKRLEMLPIECVIRNRATGSICRRLGVASDQPLQPPTFEMFLKNDELGDPLINRHHIATFGWASQEQVDAMIEYCHLANRTLSALFDRAGIELVDFKLEFGVYKGTLLLGDEFTPDSCRLRDKATGAKLDKDLFRQGDSGVVAAYQQVAERLERALGAGPEAAQ